MKELRVEEIQEMTRELKTDEPTQMTKELKGDGALSLTKELKGTGDPQVTVEQLMDIVSRNPFAAYNGMEMLQVQTGYARGRIPFAGEHENVYGGMHGGCAYTLADTLAGVAAASYGQAVTTLNASVNYMLPVKDTRYLYGEAKVQRHGSRISVVRTELSDDDGRVVIDGSFTFYTISRA